MKNVRWKACESSLGIYLGAYRAGTLSGRVPLSGQNSGTTRSDCCHNTIFAECKRSKTYLSSIRLWETYQKIDKKNNLINILTLPIVENNHIISKTSDIWCFHNDDSEPIYNLLKANDNSKFSIHDWKGGYPAVLTLYHHTVATWKSSILDKDKQLAHCAIFSHNKIGFWIIINKNDIIKWWELILAARIEREKMIKAEEEFNASKNIEQNNE
jgi:hypothetical protein